MIAAIYSGAPRDNDVQGSSIDPKGVQARMVEVNYRDTVALVRLNRGITNAINLECVRELADALQQVKTDSQAQGMVLSGTNDKFFSIGFDIPQLYDHSEADFKLFYDAFNQVCLDLYTLPKPTVAALTGHAIAGGCILALCCDYRLIAAGRKLMGLNEVKLGVPVPYLIDCVLRNLVGVRHAREIVELGEFYRPEQSLRLGMVDEVIASADVLARAAQKAEQLGALPQRAYELIKRNRVEEVAAQVLGQWEDKKREFVRCWYSEVARERLRAVMDRF